MIVSGLLLPLGRPTLDGRIVTDLTVETGADFPVYLGRIAPVGHVFDVRHEGSEVFIRAAITMPDLVNQATWPLYFEAALDRVVEAEREAGCPMVRMGGRLRRVVLGRTPAFEGTEVHIQP